LEASRGRGGKQSEKPYPPDIGGQLRGIRSDKVPRIVTEQQHRVKVHRCRAPQHVEIVPLLIARIEICLLLGKELAGVPAYRDNRHVPRPALADGKDDVGCLNRYC
jgi:hypothetical protein